MDVSTHWTNVLRGTYLHVCGSMYACMRSTALVVFACVRSQEAPCPPNLCLAAMHAILRSKPNLPTCMPDRVPRGHVRPAGPAPAPRPSRLRQLSPNALCHPHRLRPLRRSFQSVSRLIATSGHIRVEFASCPVSCFCIFIDCWTYS